MVTSSPGGPFSYGYWRFCTVPIYGFVGLPGAGKTYALTRQAFNTRKRHPERTMIANYPIYLPGKPVLFTDRIEDFFDVTNCDVYLDEAHLWLNAREWKKQMGRVTEWLSQLRHDDTNLYFTSQAIGSVDKIVRDRCQEVYSFESFRKGGFFWWECYSSWKCTKKDMMYKGWFWFSKKVAECYDTTFKVRV